MTDRDLNPERTKKQRLISQIILVSTGAIWLIWDLFPAINAGRGDTLSENIRDFSRHVIFLPLLWGCLGAHFFINLGQADNYIARFYVLIGFAVAAVALDLVLWFTNQIQYTPDMRIAAYFVGNAIGLLLWSQTA